MTTTLKDFAKSYTTPDGQVTFHLLPFLNLDYQMIGDALQEIVPRYQWVNKKTAAVLNEQPDEHLEAVKRARRTNQKDVRTDWKQVDLWKTSHSTFVFLHGVAVEIEFHLTDQAPGWLRAFKAYWEERDEDIATRWRLFQQLFGSEAIGLFWQAFDATREKSMSVPADANQEALKDADDPEAASGEAPTT